MIYEDNMGELESCERNLGIREALRRLVGHPVLLHLVNGQTFRGIVLHVGDNAIRIISGSGCRTLVPLLHISAVREPQLSFDVRCIRGAGSTGSAENCD